MYNNIYFRQADSSYLDVPRLHFTGQFRADVNTRNNENCNFDLNNKLYPPEEWNFAGTEEFEFFNTNIISVIDKDGKENTNSELLDAKIFSNEKKPFGKIVDLDVDFQISSIYGLRFGLKHKGTVLFTGTWSPSPIVHDLWQKVKCSKVDPDLLHRRLSVQSTTKIVNIVWSDSTLISDFKAECKKSSDELHVSITLDSYSCDVFTIGRVYGTIGITDSKEPLCVGGERKMEPVDFQGSFNFKEDHPCSGYPQNNEKPWTYGAPFKLDLNRKVLVVDLSNALPTRFTSIDFERITAPLDLGDLHFGYIIGNQVKPVGSSIPYLKSDMWKRSGVIEVSITDEDDIGNLQNSQLVVFIELSTADSPSSESYNILLHGGAKATILLKETQFFVRPMGYYMTRLQHSSQLVYSQNSFMSNSHEFTLLVTKFGKPISDTSVTLTKAYNQYDDVAYPDNAVTYDKMMKVTNKTGHVNYKFTLKEEIPINRHYTKDPECVPKSTLDRVENSPNNNKYYVLPIDGQVYNFYYCVGDDCKLPKDDITFKALISILAFSTITYADDEPTWVDDVKSIFEQQHHLVYAMRNILDMSNFTEVTLPHNIELLKNVLSRDSKEAFETDPDYMPTTRNLSPVKRTMILKWLEKPCFNKTCVKPDVNPNNSDPPYFPRCSMHAISFESDPQDQDKYFKEKISEEDSKLPLQDKEHPPRPLFGLEVVADRQTYQSLLTDFFHEDYQVLCNLTLLQKQLQQAVQLEFYTIPLYVTSLYSIIEHHNKDAYQAIRQVVMQEMLHFVQAANILIAIGGNVMIDGPEYVPKYPTTGLPGCVHPNLKINLENYNLEHIHNTFMIIELPTPHMYNLDDISITFTIAMFYKEIELCI